MFGLYHSSVCLCYSKAVYLTCCLSLSVSLSVSVDVSVSLPSLFSLLLYLSVWLAVCLFLSVSVCVSLFSLSLCLFLSLCLRFIDSIQRLGEKRGGTVFSMDKYFQIIPSTCQTSLTLFNQVIFTSFFLLYSRAEKIYEDYNNFRAIIRYDGVVRWEPGGVFQTMCQIDITYYPFDEQVINCLNFCTAYFLNNSCIISYEMVALL